MSQQESLKLMRDEIEMLNRTIDLKIIKGLSYAKESKRHRFLVSKLSEKIPGLDMGWLERTFKLISAMMI